MLAEAIPHTLPWYFGAVVGLLWLAVVIGVIVVLRARLRARAERRRHLGTERPLRPDPPDDRSLGPGTDVEPW